MKLKYEDYVKYEARRERRKNVRCKYEDDAKCEQTERKKGGRKRFKD